MVGIPILLFLAHPLLLTLICFSLCSLPTISCRFRRDSKSSGRGPPTYPIIGCLFSFYKNSHRLLDWYTDLLSRSATQTIVIRRLGARRTIITANPENVEYILKTKFTNYPKGKAFTEILDDFLGHGIFNVDGELWYTQRKLASHEFSARSLQDYIANTLVEEVESKLLPIMESLAIDHHEGDDHDHHQKAAVDLQELLRGLAFDIVCKLSLGIDPCCLDPSLSVSSLADAFNVASAMSAKRALEPVSVIWKIKRFLGLGSERRLKDAIKEIRAFVTKTIQEKKKGILEGESGGEDLLSKMILAGHDEVFLRDMVISFIMAGRDTTSAAMTWLFYMLSQNQEVEEKVMREIIGFGEEEKKLSSYEALREMRYLEACLCESMRLFPPVAWDSKHAVAGDSLPDGTAVGAGDRVTYFPYGMGRMEVLWGEDRLEFKPERWLSEPEGRGGRLKKVCPFKFPVFQAGPRVCLGKEMAFIQMKYIVASILKRFEIRPPGLGGRVFVPMLTAHMAGGFKVFVHRRRKPIMVTKSPENSSIKVI